MFKSISAAALLAALFVAPGAQAGDFFVGAKAGQAYLPHQGFKDNTTSSVGIDAGYLWHPLPLVQIGVEASATKFGDLKQQDVTGGGWEKLQASFYGLGANARVRLGPTPWFLIGRAGYTDTRQKGSASDYTDDAGNFLNGGWNKDKSGAYYGVGLGMNPIPFFSLQLTYDSVNYARAQSTAAGSLSFERNDRAQSLNLGAEFKF